MVTKDSISFEEGELIAERYQVLKCLGTGSMGSVYACKHLELQDHTVAVKVLYPEVAKDEVSAQRFRNEIFASYGVSHKNVVRAYEYIKDGDLVAYSMEYVEGMDLADKLAEEGSLPLDMVVSILLQMSRGMQAIHAAGIVHRDLKPENIILANNGDVKIADFGIARTSNSSKLTEHGGVVGTIDYVSPEYILNSQLDNRSDIYALGVLAYEMVTGELPFKGESVYSSMTKRLESEAIPPIDIRKDCPQILSDIVLKSLAVKPEERYQSAEELEDILLSLLRSSLLRSSLDSEDYNEENLINKDEPTLELQPEMVKKLRDLVNEPRNEIIKLTDKLEEIDIEKQYVKRAKENASIENNSMRRSTLVIKNPFVEGEINFNTGTYNAKPASINSKEDESGFFLKITNFLLCVLLSLFLVVFILKEFFPEIINYKF